MTEEIERRLAAAAEQLREYEVTAQRGTEMQRRMTQLATELDALRAEHAAEHEDVERLAGVSLTRVLASLRGSREDRLARERAEADATHLRVREAESRLDAVRREYEAAQARLAQLVEAPATYGAVLDEKERWLGSAGDPRGARLLAIADERGRLAGELREIGEALGAAAMAQAALAQVTDRLGSAASWSTYDTFLGGGMVGSAMKHSRLDEAAAAAAHADQCLAALRTELADVGGVGLTAPQLAMDGTTRFLDVWFDNVFTDLAVRDRIKQAEDNVARSAALVEELHARLQRRAAQTRARLDELETERREVLTRQ